MPPALAAAPEQLWSDHEFALSAVMQDGRAVAGNREFVLHAVVQDRRALAAAANSCVAPQFGQEGPAWAATAVQLRSARELGPDAVNRDGPAWAAPAEQQRGDREFVQQAAIQDGLASATAAEQLWSDISLQRHDPRPWHRQAVAHALPLLEETHPQGLQANVITYNTPISACDAVQAGLDQLQPRDQRLRGGQRWEQASRLPLAMWTSYLAPGVASDNS